MRTSKAILVGLTAGLLVNVIALTLAWTPSTGVFSVSGGVTNQVSAATNIISTTSNAVAMPACASTGGPESVRLRLLQNVGLVPVLYCLGGTASAANYHGVLAPGLAVRDGLGSVVNLTAWRGSVSIAVESGTGTVVAVEVVK